MSTASAPSAPRDPNAPTAAPTAAPTTAPTAAPTVVPTAAAAAAAAPSAPKGDVFGEHTPFYMCKFFGEQCEL